MLIVPGVKPVVDVEAVGAVVSKRPALDPLWIGLLRKKVSTDAGIASLHRRRRDDRHLRAKQRDSAFLRVMPNDVRH